MDTTEQAIYIFNKHARDYQNKFMDVSLYHNGFDLFCNSITNTNAEVLELACGPGNITKYLLDKRPDLKILGTDLAPNMIELAKINNPSAQFQLMDARDLLTLKRSFDAIMAGFCLPYLSEDGIKKLFQDCYSTLKPGGVIYISTMEENEDYRSGVRTSSQGDQMYMYYHKAGQLTKALEGSGFKIIDMERKEYQDPEGKKTTDLIFIATK